ncbi:MAG TPA: NUDIX hydrolase [Candidatus Saccharimonadales bacterium]|nr:NUDIX hydrolase [Candidatus Saccharimonadales bacterium]
MSKDKSKWTKHSSKIVHSNPWFNVQKDEVTKPNGDDGEYFIVNCAPACFIIAQDSDEDIYLIGQYRYAIGEYSLEIPAGSTEGGDPLETAKRELWEETGLKAENWEKLGEVYSANGLLHEKAITFLATGLTQTGEHEQEEEGIDKLVKLPLDEILKMIRKGKIKDGQTITSLLLFLTHKKPSLIK